jgi:hypothetical protein
MHQIVWDSEHTDIVLEESIKGSVGNAIQIYEPGRVVGDQAYVIPAVTAFIDAGGIALPPPARERRRSYRGTIV